MSDDAASRASGTRWEILARLKERGPLTPAALAEALDVSQQAIGQHLAVLRRDGLVAIDAQPSAGREGRPPTLARLTDAGEHAFPKHYDALALLLIDAVAQELGGDALDRVLEAATAARAAALLPFVRGLPLAARLQVVRRLYRTDDPWLEIVEVADGFLVIERNCPFLRVAQSRPLLCSTSVSLLARLLGVRVVREKRFQDGDGCCVFHVYAHEPTPERDHWFEPEPARR